MRIKSVAIILLSVLATHGRDIVVCSPEGVALPHAGATGFDAAMDTVWCGASDATGRLVLPRTGVECLLLEHPDYSSTAIRPDTLASDTVCMRPHTQLQELEVTAETTEHFLTHDSYRLPLSTLEKYRNVYAALNEIPQINVFPNNAIYYRGNDNVKLLINGVESDYREIIALPADDIDRINVYSTPPLRYAAAGVDAVVDIITKSNLRGGNAGVDITQAFKPVAGSNSLFFNYNYRRSRFKVAYDNTNEHFRKVRRDETLDYTFNNEDFHKHKKGLDSRSNKDNNRLKLTFQNNKAGDYLVSLQAGIGLSADKDSTWQRIAASAMPAAEALGVLRTTSTEYWGSAFLEKMFGDKGSAGTLTANAYYQRINSDFSSLYAEAPVISTATSYRTALDAAIASLDYELPIGSSYQLSVSAQNTFKNGQYREATKPFSQKSNDFTASAGFMMQKGRFRLNAIMGVAASSINSTLTSARATHVWALPRVYLSYYPSDASYVQLSYSARTSTPTLAELSETDQWVDTRLIYRGNADLRPFSQNTVDFAAGFNSKYVDISLDAMYIHSPHTICEYFVPDKDYILQTLINLERYHAFYGLLNTTFKPLGNYTWIVVSRLQGAVSSGRGLGTDWNGYRFQWHVMTNISLAKWNINASYQYPGKVNVGQRILPRAQHWDVTCWFSPAAGLWTGLKWTMPLGKRFSERQYTIPESNVAYSTTYSVADRANYLSLQLMYNFSFGKNRNRKSQSAEHSNSDNGLRHR